MEPTSTFRTVRGGSRRMLVAAAFATSAFVFLIGTSPVSATETVSRRGQLVGGDRTVFCDSVCGAPGPGNAAHGKVDLHHTFATRPEVWITITFRGDLLDPGDSVCIDLRELPGTGPCLTNLAPVARTSVTLSPAFFVGDPAVDELRDGRDTFTVYAYSGSERVASVTFLVTG